MRYINIEKENILKVCNGGDESEISFYMLNGSLVFLKRFRSNDELLLNLKADFDNDQYQLVISEI